MSKDFENKHPRDKQGQFVDKHQSVKPNIELGAREEKLERVLDDCRWDLNRYHAFCGSVGVGWKKLVDYGWQWDKQRKSKYVYQTSLQSNGRLWKIESLEAGGRYLFSVSTPVEGDEIEVWVDRSFSHEAPNGVTNANLGRAVGRGVTVYRSDGTEIHLYANQDDIYIKHPGGHIEGFMFRPDNEDYVDDVADIRNHVWIDEQIEEVRAYRDFLDRWHKQRGTD